MLLTRRCPGPARVAMLPLVLPGELAMYVNLALGQLLNPNASIQGHLCGLMAGLIWGQVRSM